MADSDTYHRFSFLSENVLVFPNAACWVIELCNISATSRASDANALEALDLTSTLVLQLPIFRHEMMFWNFYCHTEPSHSSSIHNDNHSAISGSPFITSPSTDGLIMFSVTAHGARTSNSDRGCDYLKFVVHRRALLELLDVYICRGGQLEDSGDKSTAQLSEDSDDDDDSSMQSYDAQLSQDSDDNSSQDSFEGVISIPWSKWGPSRTRWFDTEIPSLEYTQLVLGQRIVIIPPTLEHDEDFSAIHIYNFNPAAISAVTSSDTGLNVVTSLDPFLLREYLEFPMSSKRVFRKKVEGRLPCVMSRAPFDYDSIYDVLVDGEIMILLHVRLQVLQH